MEVLEQSQGKESGQLCDMNLHEPHPYKSVS